jgi:hypothetical protein
VFTKGFEKDIDRIFEVAKYFQDCINIAKRIRAYEKELEENEKMRAHSND